MFTHTHDGVPCQMDGCGLPYDKPTMLRDEYLDEPYDIWGADFGKVGIEVPIGSTNVSAIGRREPGDRVLPLRLVLVPTGQIMIRCVGMKPDAHGCSEEWDMTKMSPADLSEVIMHAGGHLV